MQPRGMNLSVTDLGGLQSVPKMFYMYISPENKAPVASKLPVAQAVEGLPFFLNLRSPACGLWSV